MRITIIKGEREDSIEAVRGDGSHVRTSFPHKGPLPHDLVHFVVESELGIDRGFWGMVAAGRHPEEIAGLAKAAGHASAKRAGVPDPPIVPLVQAERAAECFEADLWSGGGGDPDNVRAMVAAGCEQSLVPGIALSDAATARIRASLRELLDAWSALPRGQVITLDWRGATA